MNICASCNSDSVVFGKTKIKVGREIFETKAEHCEKCGHVAIGPQLQAEIDKWALGFSKSIVELQPYFSEAMLNRVTDLARMFNLSKSEFMKVCTVFFLLRLTRNENFKTLRTEVIRRAQAKYQGKREKVCVPIKYQLFKKVDLYTRVWKLEYEANVMEEAVQFCVAILDHRAQIEETKRQRAALINFVRSHAMAS